MQPPESYPDFQESMCNAGSASSEKVCDVLRDNEEAQKRMISGNPVLGVFLEPGRCDALGQHSEPGPRHLRWSSTRWESELGCDGLGLTVNSSIAELHAQLSCPTQASGGLGVKAKWRRTPQTAGQQNLTKSDRCSFSGDALNETISAETWSSQPKLPRWRCFDVANSTIIGYSSPMHRILMFSVGDAPCTASTTTSSISNPPELGSASWRSPFAIFFSLSFLLISSP